jgi:hypothetical protein
VHGASGSFVLQDSGTTSRSLGQQLSIAVVPDSGTEALAGIQGCFVLRIEGGQHHYALEYTLPG